MAFIFTPRQLSLRSELYHQLGALTTAGLPLRKALETLHENPISRSFRAPLRRIDASLEKGQTFAESITLAGGWLAEFDIALLRAGEESGRLDACFKLLSDYYQNRAQLARTILGEMAYPLLVLHAPVFIMPFATALLSGDWSSYGRNVLATLLPLYAVVFLIIFACQGRRGEIWRHLLERAGGFVPILGTARRSLALSRLAISLEALLNAGTPIARAWELASAASGSTVLHRSVAGWLPRMDGGVETPAELVRQSRIFPELFGNLYATGEATGSLDDALRRLYRYYEDAGTRSLMMLARWLPRFMYLCVVAYIGTQVVSYWVGYYTNIMDVFE